MRILFLGDIMGRSGREAVVKYLPKIKRDYAIEVVVCNGENATHGFGLSAAHADDLFDAGVDIITNGNHVWDKIEITDCLKNDERFLRPHNFPDHLPGTGIRDFYLPSGKVIKIVNIMGQINMRPLLDNPFVMLDRLLPQASPRTGDADNPGVDAILVDIHADITSEKGAMGYMLDGRVSLVVGTHTHIPTADTRILPFGTGFQTDAGMCGDYDSIIGMDKNTPLQRFLGMIPTSRLHPADGEGTLCGVFLETDPATGLASHISPLRVGGSILQEAYPTIP